MIKRIFGLLYKIIAQPAKVWSTLSEKKDTNSEVFLTAYLYPLFGIIALLSLVGVFITKKAFDIQTALRSAIHITATVFLGFYLASFLLSELMVRMFGQEKRTKRCQRFVAYSSALIYALYLILAFFPDFFFLKIAVFYTIYIIWEGAGPFMDVNEDKKLNFTIFAGLIVMGSPYLIEVILFMVMPGLRV